MEIWVGVRFSWSIMLVCGSEFAIGLADVVAKDGNPYKTNLE